MKVFDIVFAVLEQNEEFPVLVTSNPRLEDEDCYLFDGPHFVDNCDEDFCASLPSVPGVYKMKMGAKYNDLSEEWIYTVESKIEEVL